MSAQDSDTSTGIQESTPPHVAPWLTLQLCVLVLIVTLAAVALILKVEVSRMPFWGALAIGLVPASTMFLYFNSVRRVAEKRRRELAAWHGNWKIDKEGQWVSDKLVDHYGYLFVEAPGNKAPREDRIRLITRLHFGALIAQLTGLDETGFLPFIKSSAVFLVEVTTFLLLQGGLIYYSITGYFTFWVIVVVELLLAGAFWLTTVKWRYTVLIVSDFTFRLPFRPPLFLEPLMRGTDPWVALRTVDDANKVESRVAKLFGLDYATITVDTPAPTDKWANNLRFVKRPDWVRGLVKDRVTDIQNQMNVRVINDGQEA